MINFSRVRSNTWLGKLLRLPLRLLPKSMTMRIRQGTLKGKSWIVGSGHHGCWLGTYELDKQRLVSRVVKPGTVFFDVGAHVGFYTLLGSVLVGSSGRVVAFEPFARNLHYLERHLALNHAQNVTVLKAAVSNYSGVGRFLEGHSPTTGHLSSEGHLTVDVVSLDALFAETRTPPPDYLKIDVEGAEVHVLEGARRVLKQLHPIILLATHGREAHRKSLQILTELGYECEPLTGVGVESSPELVATFPTERSLT